MDNLPRDRVVPEYPFNCSSVDFCGPFMIRKTFVGANKEIKRFLKLIEDSDDNSEVSYLLRGGETASAGTVDIPANFELTQPRHTVRRRNVNFDYEARDDPIEDPTLKYKAEFYFFTLDKAINAFEFRFDLINTDSNYFQFLYNI
ncbi:uncharacterized protein TNCV_1613461 [Trichonephila clavipes]|nr:uncharacterized protein TNCV_1613461 [Trichonephila clavipes]